MRIIFAAVLSITQRPKIQKKAENNEFYNLKVNKAMNIKEFESLTGLKVTAEEYADIEKVYMAAYGMDKQEFCAAWKDGKLCYIVDELVKHVQALEEVRDRKKAQLDELDEKATATAEMLLRKANSYEDAELKKAAIELVGLQRVVLIDVEHGYKLSAAERDYILENI